MHLENLKIEANQKYSNDFLSLFPKKKHGQNRIEFYSLHDVTILPNERKIIPLELTFAVDDNTILMLLSNEEIARQNGIMTLQQVVSSHDRGEYINITMWNTTQAKYQVNKGDVIANGYIVASPIQYDIQRVKKV